MGVEEVGLKLEVAELRQKIQELERIAASQNIKQVRMAFKWRSWDRYFLSK